MSIVCKRIKESRERLGWSKSEFSRVTNQARTTVHNWESGRNKPDEDTMVIVAAALKTSISYLYGETDDPRPARDWHTSPSSAQQHALSQVRDQLAQLLGQVERLMEADLVDVEMAEQIRANNRSKAAEILQPEKSTTREAK